MDTIDGVWFALCIVGQRESTRMGVEGDRHPRPLNANSRPFAVAFLRIARVAHLIPPRPCVSAPLRLVVPAVSLRLRAFALSSSVAVRSAVIPFDKPPEDFLGVRGGLLADSLFQLIRFVRIEIAVIAVGVDP
jgi:hypothetical protein